MKLFDHFFNTVILLFFPVIINAQKDGINEPVLPNVILSGEISNYSNYKQFYYSHDLHSKADTLQKISVKEGNRYSFDLSKTSYKNKPVDKLYFGWELNTEGKISNDCYSVINIGAIRDYCTKNNLKTIALKNDFNLVNNCEMTVAEEFSYEQKEIGGNYRMVLNDTSYYFELSTYMLSTFTGNYTPRDKNFCNKLWGWWGYMKDKKELGVSLHYYFNSDWGIYINANRLFSFTVSKNETGKLGFKNINGNAVLEKL